MGQKRLLEEEVLGPTATLICHALLIPMGDLPFPGQKQRRSGWSRGAGRGKADGGMGREDKGKTVVRM